MAERGVFYLTIVEGKDSGETIQLRGDVISLGGGPRLDATDEDRIVFGDLEMAGTHAVLIWQPRDCTYLVSNRSVTNPIKVNGTPSGHALLTPGMRLEISHIVLEVSAENYAGPTETKAAPARIQAEKCMYLGEVPEENSGNEHPAWLAQGGQVPSVAKMQASWDQIAETAEREREVPAFVARKPVEPVAQMQMPESLAEPATVGASAVQEADNVAVADAEPVQAEEPAKPTPLGVLLVVRGANKGKSIEVFGDVLIGRNPDCDLVLEGDGSVSRQHCTITFEDGKAFISNISNSNTTRLGSSKVKRAALPSPADITLANKVQLRWTATK